MPPAALLLASLLTPAPPKLDAHGDPLPPGAVLRLGTTAFRAAGLTGVGLRPNGDLVASAGRSVLRWPAGATAPGGVLFSAPEGHGMSTPSRDGRYAATIHAQTLTVWDLSQSPPATVLTREKTDWYTLAISPTNTWVAFTSQVGAKRMLVLGHLPKKAWWELPADVAFPEQISFSADESRVAVAVVRDTQVYDTVTGTLLVSVKTDSYRPAGAALDPAGSLLAVLPMHFRKDLPPMIRFYDVPTGQPRPDLVPPPPTTGRWVAFGTSGKTLLVPAEGGWREWDYVAGKEVRFYPGPAAHSPVFSADGKRVAAFSGTTLGVWDARTGTPVRPDLVAAGHKAVVREVAVRADGKVFATHDMDGEVRTWDAATGRQLAVVPSSWGNGVRILFAPDTGYLIAIAADRFTPTVWNPLTGKQVRRFESPSALVASESTGDLRLSRGGTILYTRSSPNASPGERFYRQWDVATGKLLTAKAVPFEPLDDAGFGPVESPDGTWVVKFGTATRIDTREELSLLPPDETGFSQARFSADGRLVALARSVRKPGKKLDPAADTLVVYDLDAKKRQAELPTGRCHRVRFSPDGRSVAVAGPTGFAVWELASGQRVASFPHAYQGLINQEALAFTPDGRRLVAGMGDGTALVWGLPGK